MEKFEFTDHPPRDDDEAEGEEEEENDEQSTGQRRGCLSYVNEAANEVALQPVVAAVGMAGRAAVGGAVGDLCKYVLVPTEISAVDRGCLSLLYAEGELKVSTFLHDDGQQHEEPQVRTEQAGAVVVAANEDEEEARLLPVMAAC